MQKFTISKWLKICWVLIVIAFPLVFSGCGTSNNSLPIFNVAGQWNIFTSTAGTAGAQGPNLFTFVTSENDLTGTTSGGQQLSGNVTQLSISFSWTLTDGTIFTYAGNISASDGATMSGTWTSNTGQSGTWAGVITNPPSSVNVTGTWNTFTTDLSKAGSTEQGPFPVVFTQTGNTLAAGTSIAGAISRFDIVFLEVGNDGSSTTFIGAVTSGVSGMSGTWTSTNGSSGSWRAAKTS
jgi:hypothetical protein